MVRAIKSVFTAWVVAIKIYPKVETTIAFIYNLCQTRLIKYSDLSGNCLFKQLTGRTSYLRVPIPVEPYH